MKHNQYFTMSQPAMFSTSVDSIWPDLDCLANSGLFQPIVDIRVLSVASNFSTDIAIQNNNWMVTPQEEVLLHLLYLYGVHGLNMGYNQMCIDHLDSMYIHGYISAPSDNPNYTGAEWEELYASYRRCSKWLVDKMKAIKSLCEGYTYKLARIDLSTGLALFYREDVNVPTDGIY